MMCLLWRAASPVALTLLAVGGAAHAGVSIDYSLGFNGVSGTVADPVGPVSHADARTFVSTQAQGGQTVVTVHGSASYGVLKAYASSNSSAGYASSQAQEVASFADSVVFNSDGLNGQAGFATLPVTYNWALSRSGSSGNALGGINIRLAGATAYVGESHLIRCPTPTSCSTGETFLWSYIIPGSGSFSGDTPASVAPITSPIVFGQSYSLQVSLTAYANSGSVPGSTGSAESDAAHSYYWGGISAITDANGHAVSAVVTSASGTNYLNAFTPAVPEPATAILLTAGLGMMAMLGRRASRRRLVAGA